MSGSPDSPMLPSQDVWSASAGRDGQDTKPSGWTLSASGPVKLLAEWMPESFAAVVNHFGADRNGDLFGKNRPNIETNRHVHTLHPLARNAFVLEFLCNGPDFRPSSNQADITGICLNGPTQ